MISNTTTKAIYTGNGTTTVFSIPFSYTDSTQIKVVKTVDEVETDITDDCTIDTDAGTVTYSPSSGAINSSTTLTIYRETAVTQQTDFTNQGGLWPESIEDAIDKLTQIAQEHVEILDRCIKAAVSSDGDIDLEYLQQLLEEAIAAQTQAVSSAKDAETSETNAAESATEAAASATQASESAALAAASVQADAYDPETTYTYPTAVTYSDGCVYVCLSTTGVTGVAPDSDTDNWVKRAYAYDDFFTINTDGNLQPSALPTYSSNFELNSGGNITPKGSA